MKTITICGKEYEIKCTAFTRFQYKTFFNRGIFQDIKVINEFSEKQEELKKKLNEAGLSQEEIEKKINYELMENLDNFIDVIEKIAYILIYTANNQIGSFEKWLQSIDKVDLSESWIGEVTEFAVNSFC